MFGDFTTSLCSTLSDAYTCHHDVTTRQEITDLEEIFSGLCLEESAPSSSAIDMELKDHKAILEELVQKTQGIKTHIYTENVRCYRDGLFCTASSCVFPIAACSFNASLGALAAASIPAVCCASTALCCYFSHAHESHSLLDRLQHLNERIVQQENSIDKRTPKFISHEKSPSKQQFLEKEAI